MTAKSVFRGFLLALGGWTGTLRADGPNDLARAGLPSELLPARAAVSVAARTSFLEGPAVDAGGNLFFSDIINNRILKMTPAGVVSIFREDSGRTNGNTFDALGRLISCEGAEQGPGGRRRVVRTDMTTGEITVLTDRYEGKRYNSPNDVVRRSEGRIWFTDPYYGEDRRSLEMEVEAVYRIDLDGSVTRILGPAADGASQRAGDHARWQDPVPRRQQREARRQPKIWAFALSADGTPGNRRLVFDFGKGRGGDGMRLDRRATSGSPPGSMIPRHAGENTDVPAGRLRRSRRKASSSAASRSPKTSPRTSPSADPTGRRFTSRRANPSTRSRSRWKVTPCIRRESREVTEADGQRESDRLSSRSSAIFHPRS